MDSAAVEGESACFSRAVFLPDISLCERSFSSPAAAAAAVCRMLFHTCTAVICPRAAPAPCSTGPVQHRPRAAGHRAAQGARCLSHLDGSCWEAGARTHVFPCQDFTASEPVRPLLPGWYHTHSTYRRACRDFTGAGSPQGQRSCTDWTVEQASHLRAAQVACTRCYGCIADLPRLAGVWRSHGERVCCRASTRVSDMISDLIWLLYLHHKVSRMLLFYQIECATWSRTKMSKPPLHKTYQKKCV